MNVIVYDDDIKFIDFMRESLDELNSKHNGIFGTPIYYLDTKALQEYAVVNYENPALYILDIMTGNVQTGYTLAEHIKKANSENLIIYVSDYKEKILSNNMVHKMIALGFILKDSDRFLSELEEGLLSAHDLFAGVYFVATTNKGAIKLRYQDIYYFHKKKGTETVIICHRNGFYKFNDSLVNIKSRLSSYFCYSTKEYIVNTQAITKIDNQTKTVYFGNAEQCPFSRTRKKELLKWISG